MKLYHIDLSEEMLEGAQIAVVPGDPGRVERIADIIGKSPKRLAFNREYCSFLTSIEGKNVIICSTGIGGSSTSIAVEELARLGVKVFIRVGTSGSIQEYIEAGSVVISSGAVRLDGTSYHFAPEQYPAVSDPYIMFHLIKAAKELDIDFHVGITASSSTFYQGQERYNSYSGHVPRWLQGSREEWRKLNVLNYEMEAATLFVMCSAMGLQAGCVCGIIAQRVKGEDVVKDIKGETVDKTIEVVGRAIADFIKQPDLFK